MIFLRCSCGRQITGDDAVTSLRESVSGVRVHREPAALPRRVSHLDDGPPTRPAPKWSRIVRSRDGGDVLDGRLIHCGDLLELQAIECRPDGRGDDEVVCLPTGVRVRRELESHGAERLRVVLYGSIGGHAFTAPLEHWMRFRWPEGAL